ncbi:hypothetical protein QBD01_001804 [Ochrobactrum sp. 19YEA23]|nr:hypothetical protein [Ochrobactrum sp. 19YEA23]
MAATARAAKHTQNKPGELAMTQHGIARYSTEGARSSATHPHVLSTIFTGDIAALTYHYVGTPMRTHRRVVRLHQWDRLPDAGTTSMTSAKKRNSHSL